MADILHRVGINATPDKVFDAIATIDGLRGWWCALTKGVAAKGGLITILVFDMEVSNTEPSKLVHWKCVGGPDEWLATELTFQLEWKDGQTFVLFKHSKWREKTEFMHHSSTKWATFLLSLKDFVEQGKGRPLPDDVKIFVGEGAH